MTWGDLLDAAAYAGISENAFWDMLPRELARHVRAEEVRREEAWQRTLLLTNHVRGYFEMEPLELEDLRQSEEDEIPTAEQYQQMVRDIKERRGEVD